MRHTFGSRPYGSGEPPSRFGPSMRGDSRRPCVGVGIPWTRPDGQGAARSGSVTPTMTLEANFRAGKMR